MDEKFQIIINHAHERKLNWNTYMIHAFRTAVNAGKLYWKPYQYWLCEYEIIMPILWPGKPRSSSYNYAWITGSHAFVRGCFVHVPLKALYISLSSSVTRMYLYFMRNANSVLTIILLLLYVYALWLYEPRSPVTTEATRMGLWNGYVMIYT